MPMINGINLTLTGNPQADLRTYMQARGCDEATAKEELQAQFGDPQVATYSQEQDEDSELDISVGNADIKTTGNPQEDLAKYAVSTGVDNDTAKKTLENQLGRPNNPPQSDDNSTTNSGSLKGRILSWVQNQAKSNDTVSTTIEEFSTTGNPQEDLKKYMELYGVDQATAKQELEAKYGVPVNLPLNATATSTSTINENETEDGFELTGNLQEDLENYMALYDVDQDTAIYELETKYSVDTSDILTSQDDNDDIEYWQTALKQAMDAHDNNGINYAQTKLQELGAPKLQ